MFIITLNVIFKQFKIKYKASQYLTIKKDNKLIACIIIYLEGDD